MPSKTAKKNANNAKQSTLLSFFGKPKSPNKTTAATTKPLAVATPQEKILSKTPKTPPTESSLEEDVDDTFPVQSPVAATTKAASPSPKKPPKKDATKPSSKRPSRKAKSSVTHKKRRVIIEDSEEEEWSGGDDDASMEEDEEDDEFDATPDKAVKKKATSASKEKNVKTPAATSATKKPSGWGFLNGSFKAKAPSSSKKTATPKNKRSKDASLPTRGNYVKQPYSDGDDLPILVHPQDFFDDMVLNQLCEDGSRTDLLQPLLETMHGRTLKIATMCSGTESPVLALDMIAKAIEDVSQKHNLKVGDDEVPSILLEHVFSCEIEPFKQSYIERNFQPKRLFRDIRELGNEKACTAFGAMIDVPNSPGCVDLLVAGTSCVDFSNLNNSKKSLTDEGESGQTFAGMLKWIQKAQPAIVILENVFGAPWDQMVQLMENNGYASTYRRMDTKNYYIPHTRQRGYLVAYLRDDKKASVNVQRTKKWEQTLDKLKRPASACLDAFMLGNDDPRVLRGRARLTNESSVGDSGESRAGRTDWTKCETRHQYARSAELLGEKRPLTGWSDSGKTSLPGFAWNEWCNSQVNRVHDLLDINVLRCAKEDLDSTYKTMIWNLSQNVDRDTMGRLALSQCLTPTGIPYVTNRGGPLVGEELLSLQGIPADDLLLTKESEANISDLAGNAMSTTVVGACILSALIQGHGALSVHKMSAKEAKETSGHIVSSLVPRPLLPTSEVQLTRDFGDYEENKPLVLGQAGAVDRDYISEVLRESWLSSRKCVTEGPLEALPMSNIMECVECGHTVNADATTPIRAYEEHNFQRIDDVERVHPPTFRRKLLDALPMALEVGNLDVSSVNKPEGVKETMWNEWKERVVNCVASQFRFAQLNRNHFWSAIYLSASAGARLELRLYRDHAEWLLFAEAPCKKGHLRDFLERPVARFRVSVSAGSFLAGKCELCLPVISTVKLTVEALGDPVDSWRSRMGLIQYQTEVEFEKLQISVDTDNAELKERVSGVYEYLPKCGGACGSMHKKISDGESEPVFFFLESGRKTLPKDDAFVFTGTCHRTSYGEYRENFLMVDPQLGYRPVFKTKNPPEEERTKELQSLMAGQWLPLDEPVLQQTQDAANTARLTSLSSRLVVPMHLDGWKICPEFVSFEVPMNESDDVFVRCMGATGHKLDLNLQKSKAVLRDLAFVTSRLTIPLAGRQETGDWLALDRSALEQVDGEDAVCPRCAPTKPRVKWTVVQKGNKRIFTPIEDWQDAAAYEVALKSRPSSWNVRFTARTNENEGRLRVQIGMNAVSLGQRALGVLPPLTLARQAMLQLDAQQNVDCRSVFEWRVVPHLELGSNFEKLVFTSNKKDSEAEQPPNFLKYPLRTEQLRSLSWMLKQEKTQEAFMEEEVCESVLPSLGWRAEGRVQRPVLVRGGVIADEVGYGKTCITLACIDANQEAPAAMPENPNRLNTKATLVIVPGHLQGQWPQEVTKFLGKSKKVVTIQNMNAFNKMTIDDVLQADIVLVNFTVLCNDMYYQRLARFCGKSPNSVPSGKKGGRHFDSVYDSCLESLPKRLSQLKDNGSSAFEGIEKDAKVCEDQVSKEDTGFRLDGKKAVYKSSGKSSGNKASSGKIDAKEVDPWKLDTAAVQKDYTNMKCPPLELFCWRRMVVDEFTYVLDKADRQRPLSLVRRLSACYRWFLSGTPRHEQFDDIERLASLLGVHLGVDEPLPGTKIGRDRASEKTGAECMSQFLEEHSMHWHERRREKAQDFLNRFVRQNIAEIDEIPGEEKHELVNLPPVERAIYLELETHLQSLEMNAQTAKMSKKKSQSDRESRMQKILQDSSSAEEALLKCCTHFNLSGESTTPLKTCSDIIAFRKEQQQALERDIVASVASAIRQQNKIEKLQPGWKALTKMEKGEVLDVVGRYLGDVSSSKSISQGADEEVHSQLKRLVAEAKTAAENEPNKSDSVFAIVNGDEVDVDDEDHLEGEAEPGKKKRKVSATKAKETKKEDTRDEDQKIFEMKKSLRDHMHQVRSLGKELCGRVRSLRYIERIRRFQRDGAHIECKKCKNKAVGKKNAGVLSCCGHTGCMECLKLCGTKGHCVEPSCTARVSMAHIVPATNLGTDSDNASNGQEGAKLTKMIQRVKEVISLGDRMIIFVQFDDLKHKIAEALERNNVKAVMLQGSVEKQVKALGPFQDENPGKQDPRVLLLKMDDEQSAGLNLTQLNHVLFAHPLLAGNQQEYDAYETQAIGRIRRYGQLKTVYVWRFLVQDSIDTSIFEERGGRPLDATTSGL